MHLKHWSYRTKGKVGSLADYFDVTGAYFTALVSRVNLDGIRT